MLLTVIISVSSVMIFIVATPFTNNVALTNDVLRDVTLFNVMVRQPSHSVPRHVCLVSHAMKVKDAPC